MFMISIPLKHIILDPTKPIDLSTIPEQDAIALIRKSYGFLSPAVDLAIENGVAIIRFDEPCREKLAEALKLFQKGNRAAQAGDYQKAIKLFAKVLETIPHHVDARRNLAMAHLETGKAEEAKRLLQECLKIDPSNVWTFVLLGNIAAKHDRNPDVAAFYYEAGLAINPGDNILLNNFAALQTERGDFDAAKELFEKAIEVDPSYPNTSYGLALLHKTTGSPEAALDQLEQLFSQPKSADIRNEPVYRNARDLYAALCAELATRDSAKLLEGIIARKADLEAITGHPISIEEDNSLEYVSATAQMAWKHGRDEHRVRYRLRSPAMTPHLVAHELEHIVLEHEARTRGRNRVFVTTAKSREHAVRSVADHIAKLQRQGYSEANISEVMLKLMHGLSNQVYNCPQDMVVEHNLFTKYPELRSSQFVSLRQLHEEALQTFTSAEIRRVTPPLHIPCQCNA